MAQFGFGLNINKTAQETGYDQYKTNLFESLGAVAKDNWNYNPVISLMTYGDTLEAEKESRLLNIEPVDRNVLNERYKDIGLYFEQDEYQSVVNIMVDQKEKELERQSIIQRGPKGSWNPLNGGFYVGAAKLATGIGVSFLDPINIGVSFIPVFGQANFARVAATTSFRTARLARGAVEGAVGATLVEPLIYGVAQKVQADYDLVDSFMNIGFGSVIGGGLHVGAGKLKDIKTARDFEARILANRENLSTVEGGEPEINFYKEYYPADSELMMRLEQTDPELRKRLLAKAIGDQQLDEPVNVTDIANADPVINGTSTKQLDIQLNAARKNLDDAIKFSKSDELTAKGSKEKLVADARKKYNELLTEKQKLNKEVRTEPVVNETKINSKKISDDLELNSVKNSTVRAEPQDTRIKISEERLLKIRTAQSEKGLNLKFGPEDTTLKAASEQLDEVNSKSQEIDDIVADYINCSNGN
nr:putative internal virion protein D [uncultured Mediterranean phage uvMED]